MHLSLKVIKWTDYLHMISDKLLVLSTILSRDREVGSPVKTTSDWTAEECRAKNISL